jgi:hypothetical protein
MKHILAQSAYLVVNKQIAKVVGLNATVLLADLISKEGYFTDRGELVEGMFFNTYKNIQKDTTLTEGKQKTAIQILKDKGLITTKLMGMPAKTHFKIHENKILEILDISCTENTELVTRKTSPNKNKEIIIKNKDISIRRKEFDEIVYSSDYTTEMCSDFIMYWTEPNKSKTKMRFELQKTFDITRRLSTWNKNSKKWDRPTNSKIDNQLNSYNEAMDIVKNIKYED